MSTVVMDTRGPRRPRPILMILASIRKGEIGKGDLLEVEADPPNFEREIRHGCEMCGKVLVFIRDEGGGVTRGRVKV